MSPDGKQVLVTGGAGGIGRHVVDRLLASGAHVTITGRTESDRRPDCAFRQVDLSIPSSVHRLGESLRDAPPDILVNLAGLNAFGAFSEIDHLNLKVLMQVNLLTPMQLVRDLLPAMIQRGSGQVVFAGSILGTIGLPYFTAYTTSKAGIRGFSESLRRELQGRGITVTHISPRAVRTRMNRGAIERFNKRSGATEDSPQRVAGIIVDAIARDRSRVTIGAPERLFVKLNALVPSLVDYAMHRHRRLAEEVLEMERQDLHPTGIQS